MYSKWLIFEGSGLGFAASYFTREFALLVRKLIVVHLLIIDHDHCLCLEARLASARPRVTIMTPEQIAQVQQSFARVAPIADETAALFYSRLFKIAPELRPLFRSDVAQQGRKLMATLAIVVHGLTRLDAILPAASALAKRHVGYGVRADHYRPVGAALLWTLERSLGSQWTPDLASAWTAAYTTLSGYITREAYDDPEQRAEGVPARAA